VVATDLTTPTGIAVLPDHTALVGERTTGRIVRVQPIAGRPVPTVRTLSVDGTGDGGLLDLAISPAYAQDHLIYAYISTAKDNRVVEFTLTGPVTPVLTGIPHAARGNTGRLAFGADGNLYVGTGDAGDPAAADSFAGLAGKVLRVSDIGRAASDNPSGTPVWTRGHRIVAGLCTPVSSDPGTPSTFSGVLETEPGAGDIAEVNLLAAGQRYGPAGLAPTTTLPPDMTDPGGCAVLDDTLFVTSKDGQSLLSARLQTDTGLLQVGKWLPVLHGTYGRLSTVTAASDGSLWLATTNRDGKGDPVATDERIIRIVPNTGPAASPA
jgi:glucose/arabinose dehydrogenase